MGWYSDGDGLSQSGDEVNVYDAGENFVTGVSFGASENKVSFDNSAGITGPIDTFSDSGGDDGSFTDTQGETGSPGFAHIAPTVAVTEVDPAGSSAAYKADWFELTNYGVAPDRPDRLDDGRQLRDGSPRRLDDGGQRIADAGAGAVDRLRRGSRRQQRQQRLRGRRDAEHRPSGPRDRVRERLVPERLPRRTSSSASTAARASG